MSTETETPTTPDPLGDWFRRIGASLTLSRDDYEAGIAAIAAHDREVAARAWDEGAKAAREEDFLADDFVETPNPYRIENGETDD